MQVSIHTQGAFLFPEILKTIGYKRNTNKKTARRKVNRRAVEIVGFRRGGVTV